MSDFSSKSSFDCDSRKTNKACEKQAATSHVCTVNSEAADETIIEFANNFLPHKKCF